MKEKFNKLKTYLTKEVLTDRVKRKHFELVIISVVFFFAGSVFTIINFTTNEFTMAYVTLSFALVALVTTLVAIFFKKYFVAAQALFVVAAIIMFAYFLIDGGAGENGFSTYWILLLPFISMMVLGIKYGSIITGLMFIAICIILYIPGVRDNLLRWKPDSTFCLRFPLVYLAAFAASALFEYSRYLTDKNNQEMTKVLQIAASHDPLTGLTNRYGLAEILGNINYSKVDGKQAFRRASCMLIDIDNFKSANDRFGHKFGDAVIVEVAKVLKKYGGDWAIRFGGDEFILLFVNKTDEELFDLGEKIRLEIASLSYENHPDIHFTVSIGIASHNITLSYRIDRVIEFADQQSALAKKQGKNCVYQLYYKKEEIQDNQ